MIILWFVIVVTNSKKTNLFLAEVVQRQKPKSNKTVYNHCEGNFLIVIKCEHLSYWKVKNRIYLPQKIFEIFQQ